ncbi:MAG: DUF4249 domain-containing protein [Bacteroidetes bacterium]|nr:DUF4249 domain-containing protein [Bacteroidota bacterium]
MKKEKIIYSLLMPMIVFFFSCKEKYVPSVANSNLNYLTVDGFLNNSSDSAFIRLSRTRNLDSSLLNSGENGAELTIEDSSGNAIYYFRQLNNNGMYTLPGMNLNVNNKYKLRIKTVSGGEYLTDEIPVLRTPPIDSISWKKSDKGVTIYTNTHDPLNNTKYYRWNYTETWQYHSTYISRLKYDSTSLPYKVSGRPDSEFLYTCWIEQNSKDLLLATSTKLSQDVISENPIRFISNNSIELSVKYSIAARQYALTKAAYEYLQNLKKNTEQTGSIFDAQPSELKGNIHSVSNPNEPVLGYITISSVDSARIYISNSEVAPWVWGLNCAQILVPLNSDSTELYFNHLGYIPLEPYNSSPFSPIWAALTPCGDCTVNRGTTKKPGFWP